MKKDIQIIVNRLSAEEKAALVSGTDFMFTNPVPRLNIPSVRMADGPHGLRVQKQGGDNGVSESEPSTAFPTAVTSASSWNPENTEKMGKAIAEECAYYGVNILLGPGANIKRNPLCGRNFEYFSEDPLLAGKMAAAEVNGVQSKGIGVSVKHFALNNAENYRFMGDSIADMRAIREVYLRVFERIIKESRPYTVMCAYNRINGVFCSDNKWLLTDTLRDEWGFDGTVMTDWGAMHDRVNALVAGLDLEMPGDTAVCRKQIIDGIASGKLKSEDLDKAVRNILGLIERVSVRQTNVAIDWNEHNRLAAEIAEDSAVLLKNENVLPLAVNKKYLVVGDLFEKMRYQGAGSSMINPKQLTTPRMAFDAHKVSYEFVRGYAENKTEPQYSFIHEAVRQSEKYEDIIVFAGLTDYVESEGSDRENMRLPDNQLALIDALVKTGKKIIIVFFGGSPVELPFADDVHAILNMYLPGQNGGTATYNLLFGKTSPSGKLAETWVKKYSDVPFGNEFSKTVQEIYKESVFVGYRYYTTAGVAVSYPFGYGLSYTSFVWRNMHVEEQEDRILVSCEVENTGKFDGADVVQLYVKAPDSDVFKPMRELRAFRKVYLKAGASERVELTFDKDDLRYYNIRADKWVMESGVYGLQLCSDCNTIVLADTLSLSGDNARTPYSLETNTAYRGAKTERITNLIFENMSGIKIPSVPPIKPIGWESRFADLRKTFMGRILYNSTLKVAKEQMKVAKKMPESPEKDNMIKGAMFLKRILDSNSLRSMSMSSGSTMPYNVAQGFIFLANGKLLRGIKSMKTPIVVPKLPKDSGKE